MKGNSLIARRVALVPALLSVVAALALSVGPSFADDNAATGNAGDSGAITWGVQPSSPKGPNLRPYCNYVLSPGSQLTDYVGVTNFSDKPLTLSVYASDAFNNSTGGFDLLAASVAPADSGTWIAFKKNIVKIPAKTRLDIPFTLQVPSDASPGDHVAGVIASYTVAGGGGSQSVTVDQRVASRMYIRISGAVTPSLAVENMTVDYQRPSFFVGPGSATVNFTLRNTGNVRLSGTQALSIGGLIGSASADSLPEQIPELLPGNSITVSVPVSGVLPGFHMTAREVVTPVVTSGGAEAPVTVEVAVGEVSFWAVPWVETGVLLLIIAAIVLLILRSRRKRRKAKVEPQERVGASV